MHQADQERRSALHCPWSRRLSFIHQRSEEWHCQWNNHHWKSTVNVFIARHEISKYIFIFLHETHSDGLFNFESVLWSLPRPFYRPLIHSATEFCWTKYYSQMQMRSSFGVREYTENIIRDDGRWINSFILGLTQKVVSNYYSCLFIPLLLMFILHWTKKYFVDTVGVPKSTLVSG